ncbi:MAG: tetratricopeptide (TPR) repeat protein [Lysobacterales bacterium]|jgi:tetratricopeptide (TPR) repeat protein
MKKHIILTTAFICVAFAWFTTPASAAMTEAVQSLQKSWAHANYETEGKDRKKAFQALTKEADKAVAANPDDAEAHVWTGIVYSTNAGEVSMFSAGKQVKRARAELDRALEIDPNAINGAAYTSLGALLFQIPGFMGGDDEIAETMLKKGVEMNADGIDSNYFYGLFLLDQDRLDEAEVYLKKALSAKARPDRPIADTGRRSDINLALNDLNKQRS